ncbi:MAG: IS630 family transposase [Candidatus Accumulibacter necessarius]|uniref:IS630 family transposase n=1 Tax=Candidatus Accumulibacter necessarius TaxID=2954386 RepID=UPI002FC3B222
MDTNDKPSSRDQWALLRFAVVGPILAAPPAVGELRSVLVVLSEKDWRNPITGCEVRFSASTIERWYYIARAASNPISALRNRPRGDLGCFPSIDSRTAELLTMQYREHPDWPLQRHVNAVRIALADSNSPLASYPTIRRYVLAHGMRPISPKHNTKSSALGERWHKWVDSMMRGIVPDASSSTLAGRDLLIENLSGSHFQRQKALVVLANEQGFSSNQITAFLGVSSSSVCRYLKTFHAGGAENLFQRKSCPHKDNDEALKTAVFCLLHEPPSLSGLNRTTWKMADIKKVLKERGFPVCISVIRTIIKKAGFRWKTARVVLTSNDPDYREKLDYVHEVLANLKPDERFFSVDEYGPFSIKIRGGRVLVPPGKQPTVPQWQKSKGWIIMTAALELSTNKLTHFYSTAKNTVEMIRMAKVLTQEYRGTTKIYLSWDAASWHMSKQLLEFIEEHNLTAAKNALPLINLAPLPAGAQFLNVIESVFSGMARAIIHNSDYSSASEVMQAIDRYVSDRNSYFLANPKRAGKKIWGMERSKSEFDASNNCKDPEYR